MATRVTKPQPSPDIQLESESSYEVEVGNDFICISAFSEQDGPVVVKVIPNDGPKSIDVDSYVLKLMSVDVNNQTTTNIFAKDTQSVISESGAQAYVHNCTLLDLSARGYARPYCFSFVTREKSKIMTYFIELLNEFTHVSNIIKHGNHKIFLDDLEIQLENMQKKLQEKLGLDVPISKIIENPAEYLQSHLEELNDENQLPTGDETNQKVDDASSEKESDAGTPYRYPEEDEGSPPGDHKFLSVDNFDFSRSPQAPLEENDENRNSANFERIEEGDDDEFHSFGDNQNPNSNKELHSKKYLCELVFSLRQIHEYLQEARKIVNSHTLGNNTAICNLVSILSNSPDLKNELQLELLKSRSNNLRSMSEICGRDVYKFARERFELIYSHFSRNSVILSLELDDLSISRNSPMINFNWENDKSLSYLSLDNKKSFPITNYEDIQSKLQNHSLTDSPQHLTSDSFNSTQNQSDDELLDIKYALEKIEEGKNNKNEQENEKEIQIKRPTVFEEEKFDSTYMYDPLLPLRIPTTTKFGSIDMETFAAGLWSSTTSFAGQGLFQIKNRYNFMNQLIYSLLTGRLVVVHSKSANKEYVIQLIKALSIFVPGCWKKQLIKYWQDTPLKIVDFSNSKLIGLTKDHDISIAPSLKKYITILDYEEESLRGAPHSESKFIEHIFQKRVWPDESTFLAHLHYELFQLSMKAYLYYRMCCIGFSKVESQEQSLTSSSNPNLPSNNPPARLITSPQPSRKNAQSSVHSQYSNIEVYMNDEIFKKGKKLEHDAVYGAPLGLREESKKHFLLLSKIDLHDLPIVEYFAEVVKEHQSMERSAVDPAAPIIRLDEILNSKPLYNRAPKKKS